MYQIDILEGYFEKKSRKEQLNEQSNTFYINNGISSSIMCADLWNIDVWILKGEGMTPEEEFKTKVEEIKQKIMSLGTGSFTEGHERGYESGYKSGYQQCVKDCDKGYEKGLEDMWEILAWAYNTTINEKAELFPEYRNGDKGFAVTLRDEIGLAEAVRRYKEDKKADAQILYSTISDLKADYTKEQILKALKDNGIEIIEVEHE